MRARGDRAGGDHVAGRREHRRGRGRGGRPGRRRGRQRGDRVGLPVPAAIVVERPRAAERDAIAGRGLHPRVAGQPRADRERAVALGVIDQPHVRRRDEARVGARDARVGGALLGRRRHQDVAAEHAVRDAMLLAAREVVRAIDHRLPRRDRAELAQGLAGIDDVLAAGAGPGADARAGVRARVLARAALARRAARAVARAAKPGLAAPTRGVRADRLLPPAALTPDERERDQRRSHHASALTTSTTRASPAASASSNAASS